MRSTIAKPLAIVILSIFGFLLIITYYADKSQLQIEGEEMAALVSATDYVIPWSQLSTADQAIHIDLNDESDTIANSVSHYRHIPLSQILEKDNTSTWESPAKKILHAKNVIQAHEAWMLLTQMGYENLFVMETSATPSTY